MAKRKKTTPKVWTAADAKAKLAQSSGSVFVREPKTPQELDYEAQVLVEETRAEMRWARYQLAAWPAMQEILEEEVRLEEALLKATSRLEAVNILNRAQELLKRGREMDRRSEAHRTKIIDFKDQTLRETATLIFEPDSPEAEALRKKYPDTKRF